MIEENELDGYVKIDRYNQEKIDRIAHHYNAILAEIGEVSEEDHPGAYSQSSSCPAIHWVDDQKSC